MNTICLDLCPAYIPFLIQCTQGTGDKVDPTVDNLIIYEEGGADATFDSTTITGSPFDPAKINSKTGLWGVLVAKSVFTSGKFYIALWEMTVDGIATAKAERYLACNSGNSDVTTLLSYIRNKKYISKSGSVWSLHIRNSADDADILAKELKDKDGNNITDIEAGVLAQELASSV